MVYSNDMSIFPSSDIITDVGRAADPSSQVEAVHRLERLSRTQANDLSINPGSGIRNNHNHPNLSFNVPNSSGSSFSTHSSSTVGPEPSPFRKFEAYILQTWLEILLPRDGGIVYGHDQASGIWRSLMAEQLGNQLAKTNALGLDRLMNYGTGHSNPALITERFNLDLKSDLS